MKRCPIAWLLIVSAATSIAAVRESTPGRFDHRVLPRSGGVIATRGTPLERLETGDPLRETWSRLRDERGGEWRVWLDRRSALPTLALIDGASWHPQESLEGHATQAEIFLRDNPALSTVLAGQFVLDREASGRRGADVWQIRFAQEIDGVRVENARFEFHVSRQRLVALGSRLWAPVTISSSPGLTAGEARRKLDAYVRPTAADGVVDLNEPELALLALDADPSSPGIWAGTRGEGIVHRLVWRYRFRDAAGIATWTGEVDAHTGELVAFWDDTHYDRIKGAVNPFTDDGLCPDQGCPEPDYPMPYVDYTENGGPVSYANQHGVYDCASPGSTIETTLTGRYFRINDQCGPISETTDCDGELELGVAAGVNCDVASGASAGNTDAARTSYYHLNLINRKARFWISPNAWLDSTVETRTNSGGGCNASWSGSINLQSANASCGNTGQQQGLVTHEWGHGLDENDGGGFDNPSEAYADIVAVIEGRQSCISRGFNKFDNCSGYGDTCLTCTGLREMDWNARLSQTPATPTGFLTTFCPSGGGPCGKESHCESHLASETIYDLATRDLPAMGLDSDTAWQLTERLWYQTRPGSGGDGYNCSMPNSDSCSVGSWYHQMRLLDDDDANLANGTPHAAAIFAAFDRHDIACGSAADPENQNTSSCPTLATPLVTFTAQTSAIELAWSPVENAASYRVYRNEIGCNRAQAPIAEVAAPGASLIDSGLANDLPVYYRVQAIGANAACESPVSGCLEASAQRSAGVVRFDRPTYSCSGVAAIEVNDVNHPSSTITVTVHSDTELAPENVTLTETAPGSARFVGTFSTTAAAPSSDGQLSLIAGDTLTVEYVDLDDGAGGTNVATQSTALADCVGPLHLAVEVTNLTATDASIDWTTSEPTNGQVEWGLTPALGNVVPSLLVQSSHSVSIGPFDACDRVYFRVSSVDPVGNTAVADQAGEPFAFNASTIQGTLYEDGFETDLGWTLEGDWEIGAPQGLGTSPGDPASAGEGLQVLGQDLSGLGGNAGDYEFNTLRSAISPVIDASSWTAVELHFDRWLNTHPASWAFVDVRNSSGQWVTVWSDTNGHSGIDWTRVSYDISQSAAGNPALQIRFLQNARFGVHAGWNVDRLLLRDGNVPTFGGCGGCVGTPSFAGLVSAVDLDPCADSGVELGWGVAAAWGSGDSGTYSVYRDLVPGLIPSPANRIATGVSGPNWTDTNAPTDQPLYYLVRAENDESCASGPANAGMTDDNLIIVAALNATGGNGSGAVGETLGLDRSGADVRLDWAAVPGAAQYTVERSSSPDSGFAIIGQPTISSFDDPGALGDGQSWFYRVTNAAACGN